jgi:DHA1 family multidrug/chloramphenicol efflux transport protein-like MFS transporter
MAFSLCSLALVLMWFTLPRTMLKKVMLERKEKGQF